MTELTKERFNQRFNSCCSEHDDGRQAAEKAMGAATELALDAWRLAERLQSELDEARQQMEADAETAAFAREILLREIRSLKEERERLQSRVTLLEGQRSKPGLIGRLLKGGE